MGDPKRVLRLKTSRNELVLLDNDNNQEWNNHISKEWKGHKENEYLKVTFLK